MDTFYYHNDFSEGDSSPSHTCKIRYIQTSLGELIDTTLYKMTNLAHPDDTIFRYYSDVLEILLSLAEEQTVISILENASEIYFVQLRAYFVQLNNQYKSIVLFNKILEISKKFERGVYHESILYFIEELKNDVYGKGGTEDCFNAPC